VDTWRWKGVPFYLRSGKRLRADYSEVAIGFREVPTHLFRQTPLEGLSANWLIFRLKPSECIDLYAWARAPGLQLNARHLVLSAPFRQDDEPEFSAYEQLLLDVVRGDRTHFLRHDEVELSATRRGGMGLARARPRAEGLAARGARTLCGRRRRSDRPASHPRTRPRVAPYR